MVARAVLAISACNVIDIRPAVLSAVADRLDEQAERFRPDAEYFVNPAKVLALDLSALTPVVLGDGPVAGVAAQRTSAMLARTARTPAMWGRLPGRGSPGGRLSLRSLRGSGWRDRRSARHLHRSLPRRTERTEAGLGAAARPGPLRGRRPRRARAPQHRPVGGRPGNLVRCAGARAPVHSRARPRSGWPSWSPRVTSPLSTSRSATGSTRRRSPGSPTCISHGRQQSDRRRHRHHRQRIGQQPAHR
uniref:Uncharacterized protein n=1 Tax=Janibacter limosus TaxID=53458 RepID=A0AC61U1T2_9MICO|nr:SIS domain-containing protein [Janibacter limosus]